MAREYKPVDPPEGYVNLADAATLAKVSKRTFWGWVEDDNPNKKNIRKETVKGQVFYNVEDIKLDQAKQAEVTLAQNPAGVPMVAAVATQLAAALRAATPDAGTPLLQSSPQQSLFLFLTMEEATRHTRLNEGFLRQMGAEGKIRILRGAGPHGKDMIPRADLERLAGVAEGSK